jgi:hypothetical protein
MKTHLVCFADERFRNAQQRLVASAIRHGVDHIHATSMVDLRKSDFYAENRATLEMSRGAGYWLWKPYFILRVLNEVKAGDFVLYMDSAAELTGPVGPLADVCSSAGGVLLFRHHTWQNKFWTKRDCFVLMGCDREKYYEADQVNAAFSGYIAGPAAICFVEEWLLHCKQPRKLTDIPSECAEPELPEFLEHRHDQSICSLLAGLTDRYLYRDPSQTGNHRKPPSARVANEQLEMPYSAESCDRSPYPTLINHHRNLDAQPSVAKWAATWFKVKLRQSFPKEWSNPYFAPADLARAIERNRNTLTELKKWFDPVAHSGSQFGYGVTTSCRKLLDRPVGSQATLPDLIGHLGESLGNELNYLEIGVSVGKNFSQQIRAGSERSLTAFDIEEAHPNLKKLLTPVQRCEFEPGAGSLKQPPSSLTEYLDPIGRNRVWYVAGDVFDNRCWAALEGRKFNFIFSDALHRPEGLLHEWRMIEQYELLDHDEFVMVWDDLGGIMSKAFDRIAAEVEAAVGPCIKLQFSMRGWLGVNEYPHQIGLISKLRNPPRWLRRLDTRPTLMSAQPV